MNILISKLSSKTQGDALKRAFQVYGQVVFVQIILEKQTRKPSGMGIVEMKKDEDANKAILLLNNTRLDGNIISVKEAKHYIS